MSKANSREFKKQTWDEFDEFFDFKDSQNENVARDDTRGSNIKLDVEIDFLDSLKGCSVELDINKRVICHTCRGTRAADGSKPRKCFECGGRGSVVGNYGIKKRCSKCDGAGCTPK
jgi:molecular chaperone DnaJ